MGGLISKKSHLTTTTIMRCFLTELQEKAILTSTYSVCTLEHRVNSRNSNSREKTILWSPLHRGRLFKIKPIAHKKTEITPSVQVRHQTMTMRNQIKAIKIAAMTAMRM